MIWGQTFYMGAVDMPKFGEVFGPCGRRPFRFVGPASFVLSGVFGMLTLMPSPAQSQVQGAAATYEFEVASVTRSPPDETAGFMTVPGKGVVSDRFIERNIPLMKIVRAAFGLPFEAEDSRISGAPSWLNAERYDINAKLDSSTVEALKKLSPDERRHVQEHMLQALLAERFKLTIHRETRELPIYTLVAGKGGAKLQEAKADEKSSSSYGPGSITGEARSVANLAQLLSVSVGHPVVDKTGLAASYDFKLKWASEDSQAASAGASQSDSEPASVFTAVQEQLGLKLVSGKGPVEVVVIDHVERPSAD
jgi:uncharacterized protein (TIGR03435 family)